MKKKISKNLIILIAGLIIILAFLIMSNKNKELSQNDEPKELPENLETATFAGGCFWCIEAAFENMDGVYDVISGYIGGETENPTYEEVSTGTTGHYEAIEIKYDPEQVSYRELVDFYWRQIDPTDAGGQFVDRGSQYKTAIFYHDDQQKEVAEQSKNQLEENGDIDKPIVTEIIPATTFYKAEEYHQDYSKKKAEQYLRYKEGSGREDRLQELWKNESNDDLKNRLTPLQYDVTQKGGTEPPFDNEYYDNTEEGIYVDVVSGEPLFSSTHKFKSGTGWPSFYDVIDIENIEKEEDFNLGMKRTEVKSAEADSHLGHVFEDGPDPTGLRYCINSASLRFIPRDKMADQGYSKYLYLFE